MKKSLIEILGRTGLPADNRSNIGNFRPKYGLPVCCRYKPPPLISDPYKNKIFINSGCELYIWKLYEYIFEGGWLISATHRFGISKMGENKYFQPNLRNFFCQNDISRPNHQKMTANVFLELLWILKTIFMHFRTNFDKINFCRIIP